jgi:ribosomal protein S18 acetylase RimI-like enzyme
MQDEHRTSGRAAPGPVSVRRAGPADARAIAEISVAGWQAAYRHILPAGYLAGLHAPPREIGWRSQMEADAFDELPSWVAEVAGEVIGFVSAGPPRDDDVPAPAGEIYALYVHPDRQRHGAGRALIDVATAHLRAKGSTTLVLWVFERNEVARAFYEAAGWQFEGRRQVLNLGAASAPEVRYRRSLAPTGSGG